MIPFILIAAGFVLLVYSIGLCHRLNYSVGKMVTRKPCFIVLILMYVFLLGYAGFGYYLFVEGFRYDEKDLLVGSVFFFGAIFVVIVLRNNQDMLLEILGKSSELKEVNQALEDRARELELSEGKYRKKTKELDEALENFYALRVKMFKEEGGKSVAKENAEIREKIDEITQ